LITAIEAFELGFDLMKRLNIIVALVVAIATLLSLRPSLATEYSTNPNPACRLLRNNTIGAPYPPEPNRADTRAAMQRAGGGTRSPLNDLPANRKLFAEAFPLMQKVDAEGTTALSELPPSTPRIDTVIDKHLINLIWARAMLGVFYEEGRAPPVDYGQAAKFYQKSVDTQFVDERGCVHSWPPSYAMLKHLAGFYAYGLGVPQNRTKAKELLQKAGPSAASIVYLLDHDALPKDFKAYLNANLDDLADGIKNPRPNIFTSLAWLSNSNTEFDTVIGVLWQGLLWLGVGVAFLVAAYVAVLLIRRKSGHGDEAGFYRSIFAAYDVIYNALSRIGLVGGGIFGCAVGLWLLLDAYMLNGVSSTFGLITGASGVAALFGGLAKLVEAVRFNLSPSPTIARSIWGTREHVDLYDVGEK
jgi:hypothetical protein